MPQLSVNRTLVKSPPELWSEFSDVERLANHLGEFGEITISRLEPEHTVTWEADNAWGTVELETSGAGTRVTMKAEVSGVEAEASAPAPAIHKVVPDLEAWDRSAAELESHAGWQTAAAQRAADRAVERAQRAGKRGLARRLRRRRRAEPEAAPARPSPLPEPDRAADRYEDAADAGAPATDERARAVLEAALDNLGATHRRVDGATP